jgi:hypothetical protein
VSDRAGIDLAKDIASQIDLLMNAIGANEGMRLESTRSMNATVTSLILMSWSRVGRLIYGRPFSLPVPSAML